MTPDPVKWARDFEARLKRDRDEFPLAAITRLVQMQPGLRRTLAALPLIPALVRMARRTLQNRWRNAETRDDSSSCCLVHAVGPGGGFLYGYLSQDGAWYTHDFVDDGTAWGTHSVRKIRVAQYREFEGSGAEPWHDTREYTGPWGVERRDHV